MRKPTRSVVVALLAAVASLVTLLAWGLASPIGSAPDDDFHLTSIWCPAPLATSGCALYRQDGEVKGVYAPQLVAHPACYAFQPRITGACQTTLSSVRTVPTVRVNQGDYPGPYYSFAHLFVGPNVGTTVLTVRSVNALLAVALIGAAVALLPRRLWSAPTFALAVGVVPMALSIVPSTNPSSWAFTGLTTFWIACVALVSADSTPRRVGAVGLGLAGAVLAAVARNDSVLYIFLALAAVTVLYLRRPARWRQRDILAWALLAGLSLGVGIWSLRSAASSTGILPDATRASRNPYVLLYVNLFEALQVPAGLLGRTGLGWNDIWPPATVNVLTLMIAGFVLFTGFREMGWRKALAVAGVGGTLVFLPVVMLQRAMAYVGDQVQPRYFMAVLPLLLAVALLSSDGRRALRFGRVQAGVVWAGLTLANAITLWVYLRRYVVGQNGPLSIAGPVYWWWPNLPGPFSCWLTGSIGFAIAALPLILTSGGTALRRDLRPEPLPAVSGPSPAGAASTD